MNHMIHWKLSHWTLDKSQYITEVIFFKNSWHQACFVHIKTITKNYVIKEWAAKFHVDLVHIKRYKQEKHWNFTTMHITSIPDQSLSIKINIFRKEQQIKMIFGFVMISAFWGSVSLIFHKDFFVHCIKVNVQTLFAFLSVSTSTHSQVGTKSGNLLKNKKILHLMMLCYCRISGRVWGILCLFACLLSFEECPGEIFMLFRSPITELLSWIKIISISWNCSF